MRPTGGFPEKRATTTCSSTSRVSAQRSLIALEPIEQNVHGEKGIYELVLFMKDTKSIARFKSTAQQFDSYTKSKSNAEIERLVSFASFDE